VIAIEVDNKIRRPVLHSTKGLPLFCQGGSDFGGAGELPVSASNPDRVAVPDREEVPRSRLSAP